MLQRTSAIRTLGSALVGAALLLLGSATAAAAAPPKHSSPASGAPRKAAALPARPSVTVTSLPPFYEMVLDEPHGLLYGSDTAGGQIYVLSLPSLTTLKTIPVGAVSRPEGIDLTPDGKTLAVARSGAATIVLVDTATGNITGTLTPDGGSIRSGPVVPNDVRFGRPGRLYSVSNPSSEGLDFVHVFDTVSKTEVGQSQYPDVVRMGPRIAITADGNSLYVMESAESPQGLTKFDISTDTPHASATAAFAQPAGVTVATRPDGSEVYLSSGQAWTGDLKHQLGTIINGDTQVAYAPADNAVYVTAGNALYKADGTSLNVVGSTTFSGTRATALAVNAADTQVYVATDAGLGVIGPPAAPTGVTATAGISSATVRWTPPTDTGGSPITGYTIVSSGGAQATAPAGATSAVVTGLGEGEHTFTVAASNASGLGPPSLPSNAVTILAGATYHPLAPVRILDTRDGTGGVPRAPIGPAGVLNVQVAGRGGVPSTGVSAVFLNVTATDTTAPSFLTVWPAGVPKPLVSNLNWVGGVTTPNLVEVALGTGGQLSVFNSAGSVDVLFDVAGWVGDATNSAGRDGMFNALQPSRLLDTRSSGPLGPGGSLNLQVAGRGGVPASGVSAVVLNVTVTEPTASSYLTVWPAGAAQPLASNLNFVPGQTVPNRVVVKLGAGGMVSIFNSKGNAQVVVDVNGWFTDATSTAGGSGLVSGTPGRFFDTRGTTGPLPPGGILNLQVDPADPRPMTALVLNVTATDPTASSFLTVWPDGAPQPLASDLNFVPGLTVPNLTVAGLSSTRAFDIFNSQGSVDVVVDVFGFYGGAAPAPPASTMLRVHAVGDARPAVAGAAISARKGVIRTH